MNDELFAAVTTGDADRVGEMLDRQPELLSGRDERGVSAILTAVYHGRANIAALFCDRGATLDVFEASALGKLDRVRELAAEANDTSADGFQPLGLACFFGQTAVAEFLIREAGADVHVASKNQMRVQPIHAAAARRQAGLIRLLLARGADPNARQHLGYTALHAAAQNGDLATVDALIAGGADPSIANDEGKTAADFAAAAGHGELAARLKR
jgi:ankyrin repeat protein